ncbi:hypothetical protein DICVIV_05678 [Dictyocaulus viviparus]|uniref:Polyprotein allergen nematode domain-containing protein n=1 Tax=Dictyocaulus viviparus TaxID=29172 RepID=A0A0D8XWT1_DICVI|nr:hypothetical protein DICVIV_05678 [Dictyocaulus viviparus]
MISYQSIILSIFVFNVIVVSTEREGNRMNSNTRMDRIDKHQRGNKYVRNILFASKLWLTEDQLNKLNNLLLIGDNKALINELEVFYRNLSDKTRASLRVQSSCRAFLADELGQNAVDELITMKTKMATPSELVEKVNSLFEKAKNPQLTIIQSLCTAAYELKRKL